MPKGHSAFEPRLLLSEEAILALVERIGLLEHRIAEMNEAFSRGNLPQRSAPTYESQFRVWPGANPASNGS